VQEKRRELSEDAVQPCVRGERGGRGRTSSQSLLFLPVSGRRKRGDVPQDIICSTTLPHRIQERDPGRDSITESTKEKEEGKGKKEGLHRSSSPCTRRTANRRVKKKKNHRYPVRTSPDADGERKGVKGGTSGVRRRKKKEGRKEEKKGRGKIYRFDFLTSLASRSRSSKGSRRLFTFYCISHGAEPVADEKKKVKLNEVKKGKRENSPVEGEEKREEEKVRRISCLFDVGRVGPGKTRPCKKGRGKKKKKKGEGNDP